MTVDAQEQVDTAQQPNPAEQSAPPEPQEQPQQKGPSEGFIRRFGELTAARRAAEERAARAEAELAAYRQQSSVADPAEQPNAPPQVHPNVHQLAQMMAENIANERVQQQAMGDRIKAIEAAGKEQFGDEFDRAIQTLQISGVGGPDFLNVLTSIPSPEKVVRYLGAPENIEETLRIAQLPPVQMALEMSKLSGKAVKAYSKQLSTAPAPIEGITGKGAPEGAEPDPKDTAAWMAWRNKSARRR